MPVQTRSQTKNIANAVKLPKGKKRVQNIVSTIQTRSKTKAQVITDVKKYEPVPSTEEWFRDTLIKRLYHQERELQKKEDKMRSSYEIMYIVSEYFPDILRNDPNRWGKFAKIVYNKIYEFEYETDLTGFDKDKRDDFINFIHNLRAELLKLFKELNIEIQFNNKNLHIDTGMVYISSPLSYANASPVYKLYFA